MITKNFYLLDQLLFIVHYIVTYNVEFGELLTWNVMDEVKILCHPHVSPWICQLFIRCLKFMRHRYVFLWQIFCSMNWWLTISSSRIVSSISQLIIFDILFICTLIVKLGSWSISNLNLITQKRTRADAII